MQLKRPLILASSSPRRQYLMSEAGFRFETKKPAVDEFFPASLPVEEVARFLADAKADYFKDSVQDEIILTADTVVILEGRILNKPSDKHEAISMLSALSGKTHRVMTGVCILTRDERISFDESTDVTFEQLTRVQIESYIDDFHPYDKAGSYGAQDCLPPSMNPCSAEEMQFLSSMGNKQLINDVMHGANTTNRVVIIKQIDGSYFNVMGLPVHKVYERLKQWQAG